MLGEVNHTMAEKKKVTPKQPLAKASKTLWAWLVHGETPGPTTIAGGVLILGATAGRMILDLKQPGRASVTA